MGKEFTCNFQFIVSIIQYIPVIQYLPVIHYIDIHFNNVIHFNTFYKCKYNTVQFIIYEFRL